MPSIARKNTMLTEQTMYTAMLLQRTPQKRSVDNSVLAKNASKFLLICCCWRQLNGLHLEMEEDVYSGESETSCNQLPLVQRGQ